MKRVFVVGLISIATLLGGSQAASAEIAQVFADNPYLDHGAPGGIACQVQADGQYAGQRWCGTGRHNANNGTRSTVESFDGVPIDVNVAFPPSPESGPDGPWPLMMSFHGYGGGKFNFTAMQRWLDRGFAVFSMSNRGFHESCGTASSRAADPDCPTEGFVRLNDTRAEVRDAQEFAGMLVDQGVVDGEAIGASGGSYGGGMSMALAALNDRTMLPDGSLVPWESPTDGTALELAVALPNIPWTDLAYSLAPNGSNIDYIRDASYFGRFGVMKQSYVSGLYVSGQSAPGYYLPAGQNLSGNITGWFLLLTAGEPYQGQAEAQALLDEITTYHSSYYIDHSVAPAPLLISSGFTDDLFPANEATRYYNRTKSQYPNHEIGLFLGSFGHPRGQNKDAEVAALLALENAWADHYLLGIGEKPEPEVTAYAQSCDPEPGTVATAETWGGIASGEVRLGAAGARTVSPDGGDRDVALAFDPISGGGACAAPAGAPEAGVASYELPAATDGGYTVMGSPTVIARIAQAGINSQIAARLVDVSPDGATKTLVNRALWRPAPTTGHQVFQLQPNGWKVEEGHRLRLELLPGDYTAADRPVANFGRPSNDQQPATISDLELRVPVLDRPGSAGGAVKAPARRVLPDRPGVRLAPGFGKPGSVRVAGGPSVVGRAIAAGNRLRAKVACRSAYRCSGTVRLVGAPAKGRKGKGIKVATIAAGELALGASKRVSPKLSSQAQSYFRGSKTLRVKLVWRGRTEGYAVIGRR